MKTSSIFFSFALVAACGGNLDVGDGPGDSSTNVVGSGSCKSTDCSTYSIQCSSGTPTNLQCVYDSVNSGCTLTGQCTDATATETCTFTPAPQNCGSGPCAEASGVPNGGEIVLSSDPTTSSSTLTVDLSSTETQTIGACEYEATAGGYGYVAGQPVPNEGTVTATSTSFTLSDPPACDGTYSPVTLGQLVDQGSVVTFGWAGAANTSNPTFPNIPAPHAITVTEPGTLAATGTTLQRSDDAPLSWTPLTTPLSLEQVGFDLVQGSKRLSCRFTSSDQAGVVPADALLELASGPAQFRMYSLHADQTSAEDGTTSFIVTRQATFSDGPAVSGTLTLQ